MRSALTLVELILSMVIVAIVFTVIPKIILATNQSFVSASKQDGIFNGVELMHLITNMPWDQNSYESFDILGVSDGYADLQCSDGYGYRVGGFIGGRNCVNADANATEDGGADWADHDALNDIDDFDGYVGSASQTKCAGSDTYSLEPEVEYKQFETTVSGKTAQIKLTDFTVPSGSSNVKYIFFKVAFDEYRQGDGCVEFDYYSANLGQLMIARRDYD